MQGSSFWSVLGVTMACTLLLSGCGQSGNVPHATPGASIQPLTTQQPEPFCEGGPLGCSTFTSVRGSDATGDVAWLGTQPLQISSYEGWTVKLFEQPVHWNLDDGVLTLNNSLATIELKES